MPETSTFRNVHSLNPAEFRRWVFTGTAVGLAAYLITLASDLVYVGMPEAFMGRAAGMVGVMLVAMVLAATGRPWHGAVLALFSAWAEQLYSIGIAQHIAFANMLQLAPLVLATGLLVGANAALVSAIVSVALVAWGAVHSLDVHGGSWGAAQAWVVAVGISLFACWALASLTMESYRRVFGSMEAAQRDYADTIRFAPHGIIVVDATGLVLITNDMAGQQLGVTTDRIVGRSIAEVLSDVRGASVALPTLADWKVTGTTSVLIEHPDGSPQHLEGSWRAMSGGRHQLLLHDVSERVKAESHRRQIETQLAHSQRLDAVGRLAGGLAHDFNNILTAVSGSAEMLRFERNPAEREALLDEIIAARDRGSALTRQLLAFARREVTQPRVVDLAEHVQGLERLLQRVLGDRSRLRLLLTPDCRVRVDPGQLEQALVNLVANARDAMPDGGTCTVTVERVVDARSTSRIRIHVADEGMGMAPEVAERAFEPFFTTKPRGQGTGLGLASVHGMAEQSGGMAHIASTRGRGTRVTIELPASDDPALDTEITPRSVAAARGRQVVLVVEDDSGTRRIVERLLHHAGYVVRTTADSREAMELIDAGVVHFDLLLTDVMMPGFTGPELAARVNERHPGTPVLLMTGYAEDQLEGVLDSAAQNRDVITKPFSGSDLTARIATLLRAASPANVA